MVPAYAELHCSSNFSFLRGASHPAELVLQAARLGYAALAITDECSLAGIVRAHIEAKDVGLRLLIGSELRIVDGLRVVLLARNRNGYGNLCELITRGRRQAPKGEYRLERHDLAIADCVALWLPDPIPKIDDARWITDAFPGRAWAAAELLRGPDDAHQLHLIQATAGAVGIPVVAAGDVHMHARQRRALQNVLTAVRIGTPVAEAGSALYPNGERYLRSIGRLANIYPPELLMETLAVAERCTFSLDEIRYRYPKEIVPDGETPTSYLRRLSYEGGARRYPAGVPTKVRDLIEYELALIADLRYEPYFLTVYDIVRFARDEKILCQGRGSAANSVVCYCLGITEVDPDRMNVLFERFISRERNEPPDIDVDFEHERREEVIQYIYTKYGREHAGMTAIAVTYRPKSALRDVGKALGFSLDQVDKLAGVMAWWDGRKVLPDRLIEAGFDPDNPKVRMLQALAGELVGFPRHLSQHPGGFVLTGDLLSRCVPIENAAMAERTVIQWDKDDLDALGLLKVDVLGLGMLSCIRGALDLINRFRGTAMRMQDIPAEDHAVYDMLCKGDSVGVFQVESRAQMSMLPRLKPRRFYDLVIEVAIVRPGPIQGGMVHPYLARRAGEQAVAYPSADVEQVLERTLGVAIFQEQVMQLAIVAAGFTAGEADRLRRAMAAWRRRGGIGAFERKLIDGMLARGYDQAYAEQIYRMIQGFGEYGFPESHAASFALLVYVSSWIKCHEPAAFCAALLNAQPLGFYAPAQLVQDAKRHGVELRPVDVTASAWFSTLECGYSGEPVVRLGLHMVKGLKQVSGERIVAARQCAPFLGSEDFFARSGLDRHDLDCLADGDALRALTGHRREALWATLGRVAADAPISVVRTGQQAALELPTEGQDIVADYRRLGLTLRRHPLALLRSRLKQLRIQSAEEVQRAPNGRTLHTGGIVTCRQRPDTASGVIFVTLEDETGNVNVVVWSRVAERQRRELLASRLLGIVGEVQRVGDVVHVVARRLVDHSHLLGALPTQSRDFH
ncbi:MAG: DNA polymerase III subunit alpha [Betaproteobacteria bacterium]|nr:DNA polymerase III subunit alpha [Betaproteobacteria bacterium]